jgi:type IV pilus assembly protein PilY1
MKQSPLGVVTYTIDVSPPTTGQGPGWTALLKSMSTVSNGKYQAVTASGGSVSVAAISKAISNDLSEIQAVNSVYAAVSLPASTNTQGSYLNQVYIGMFRPDPNANPRWMGNLKQYQMGFSGTALIMEDADGKSAINNQTGFITECARSFWTPTTVDTYWAFFPEGACLPPFGSSSSYYQNSNFPDGNVVEKGGEAYHLRSSTTRTMYTCPPTFSACSTSISNLPYFDTNNSAITPSLLGVATSTQATSLIQYERGLDVLDENNNGITTAEMGPSVHGDVIHSHPTVINYGTDTSPQVVAYYGGNDGAFRAVNGNQSGNINGVAPGGEMWSFVPPEFWGAIQRLYNNSPVVTFPNITATGTQPKSYGIDGPVTSLVSSNSAWLYAPMRRGGRVVYAFDVSSPAVPRLKWKVGCPNNIPEPSGTIDDTGCTSGFTGMGQAWSSAKVIKAAGYGGGGSPLILMGGGYDTCEDNDPNTCTSSTKGNKVYVLDASSGTLLNTFSTTRAVVADVAIVPDASGQAVYGYVVDLGGNIYRITMGSNSPGNWTMSQIASLGCATPASCTANRKFMFAPDIVYQNGVYTLLLGSGDREKPLLYTALGTPVGSVVNSVTNYFFAVEDNPNSSTWLSSESGNCGSAILCLNSLLAINTSTPATPSSLMAKKGWYLGLTAGTEQVVTAAITIYGTVYFSTHQPAVPQALSCTSSLGTTRLYTVPFSAPVAIVSVLPPVGLPPSPTAGLVTVQGLAGEVTIPFCIGCSPESPLQSTEPQAAAGTVPTQPKARVYWYIQR